MFFNGNNIKEGSIPASKIKKDSLVKALADLIKEDPEIRSYIKDVISKIENDGTK